MCLVLAAALATFAGVGCKEKKEEAKGDTVSGARVRDVPSAAPAPLSEKATRYVVADNGKASIDMPAPSEHIKAETTASAGWIDVDPTALATTHGEVRVDLATLTTKTFDDTDKNKSQTEHARTWLEVVIGDAVHEENRWAVFTLQSVDGLTASDLSKVDVVKQPGGDGGAEGVRTVSMLVHGELAIHGHSVPKTANVQATFHYPDGAAADARPAWVEIKTTAPMRVTLADHDVKPRDTFGVLAKKSFNLLGTKVADVADVSLELKAAPKP